MDLPQQETIAQYLADGVETEYDFAYLLPLAIDIDVYVTLAGQPPLPDVDIQTLGVDYNVSINELPLFGGTVEFEEAPASGAYITLVRNVKASIDTDYQAAANINGQNLDGDFERVTLVAQQNKSELRQRAFRLPIDTYLPDDEAIEAATTLPDLTTANNLIWKSQTGTIIATELKEDEDVSTLRSDLASEAKGGDGAGIIGYYDENNDTAQTLRTFLNNLPDYIRTIIIEEKLHVPTGAMIDFGQVALPSGYLPCDGSAVSRTTYADLFSAIGTTWGIGDGSTTFNLPDRRRRVSMGAGGDATPVISNTPGSYGGGETHTLTEAEIPSITPEFETEEIYDKHNSAAAGGDVPIPADSTDPGASTYGGLVLEFKPFGGGEAHSIVQSALVCTVGIKT